MTVMVQVNGKNFNATILVNFELIPSEAAWDEATQIDLNCCY